MLLRILVFFSFTWISHWKTHKIKHCCKWSHIRKETKYDFIYLYIHKCFYEIYVNCVCTWEIFCSLHVNGLLSVCVFTFFCRSVFLAQLAVRFGLNQNRLRLSCCTIETVNFECDILYMCAIVCVCASKISKLWMSPAV